MTTNYFYIEKIYNLIRINIISLLKYTFLSPVIIFIAAWPCTEYFPGIIAHFIIALSASVFSSLEGTILKFLSSPTQEILNPAIKLLFSKL